ncbi:ribbon-helix-helix domain-containing protein [Pokkaliibacter plantistimulans]|uniref:ribbon-helix-helix domain-containing protein n=1 Tax=Pokkaliibacter plantistimulans TaxID=1635171 RepID=UPI000D7459ED|nr:ribbon-helix-helix domain-containing protein [Pokkaliibacter plantistimulans]
MCDIYASTDPALYEPVSRSIRLNGQVTSLRLERRFWTLLDQLAHHEQLSTPQFVSTLYLEVLQRRGEIQNFASLLRVICTEYASRQANTLAEEAAELL